MSGVGESESPGTEEISDEPDFEASLESLESLVSRLEQGDLSLEESLRAFEDGVRLVRICSGRLQAAELRITELTQEGADTRAGELEVPAPEPQGEDE